jgi:spermidine synthase
MRGERSDQSMPDSAAWRLPFLSVLLMGSGACALVYQTAWLREFRLIFGGATPATAAVLAVFMGGLGVGGAWWGRRAERSTDLLRLYAGLELGIGATVALTPFFLDAVRALYVRTGGALALGPWGATAAQLLLTAVVLGVPCVLLGGNLPPAVKWIETDDDRQRGALGVLYGCNAFGAVLGVLGSTFWSLEHWGTRATLWLAAGINILIGLVAWLVARGPGRPAMPAAARRGAPATPDVPAKAPPVFVYVAAAMTGFTFFLAELVWYRLLTPLLGGSVYCFGLILAHVLFGMALGGWLYRGAIAATPGRASLTTLASVATAQAVALALPWALGDRLAVLAFHVEQWRNLGFAGLVAGWSFCVALMVVAPAILAGVQFPLLVGLLGEGRQGAARQVGLAYAANTVGAIGGCLLGGFVLLPWLSAPGCWRLVTVITLGLAVAALGLGARLDQVLRWVGTLVCGALAMGIVFLLPGPSGAWRHSGLGYGVVSRLPSAPAGLEDSLRSYRRWVAREYEGRESSIGVVAGDSGWALFSNGKADGSALADAGTQIMLGLVSALEHPAPRSALVVGLGTGSSAGWLADVPGMERVDVIELEPRVVDVARDFFSPVNRDALEKQNLNVILADAREVLLATGRRYDLIASEPPNPYRAGVASLFTREYYEAVRRRLAPGGIFSQWLQGYSLSNEAVQIVYATLLAVFPFVETWTLGEGDLLFVAHLEPPAYPLDRIRQRLSVPLFREALERAWLVNSVEGVFAHYFAGTATARRAAAGAAAVNRDDRNLLEYGLARAQFSTDAFQYNELLGLANEGRDATPAHLSDQLDRARLIEARMLMLASRNESFDLPPEVTGEGLQRARAIAASTRGDFANTLALWTGPASTPAEQLLLVNALGRAGTPDAGRSMLGWIQDAWPVDARVAAAWLAFRNGAPAAAVEHLVVAFRTMQKTPWVRPATLESIGELLPPLVAARPQDAAALLDAAQGPSPVGLLGCARTTAWYLLAGHLPLSRRLEVLDAIGPNFPWTRDFLEFRAASLQAAGRPEAAAARRDVERFLQQQGGGFAETVRAIPTPR